MKNGVLPPRFSLMKTIKMFMDGKKLFNSEISVDVYDGDVAALFRPRCRWFGGPTLVSKKQIKSEGAFKELSINISFH